MVFLKIIFLILMHNLSWSKEASTSELLSQYETLQPFHENMSIIMPDEKCKTTGKTGKHCWIDIKWEDHPEPFEDLLRKTENSVDVSNPDFALTPLGQKYRQLKTLMNIHKKLKSCSTQSPLIENNILYRIQSNIALSLENPDECDPALSSLESSTALFGSHLQQINKDKITKTSAFEDDLFSQALKTSIQTRINFTRQTEENNINAPKFKQNLLEKFCKGDIPVLTSRGLRNKQGWACSKRDEEIIRHLIEEAVKSAQSKELIQHPTKLSRRGEKCFINQRKRKCVNTNTYEFQSTPPQLAEEGQMDLLNKPAVVSDINNRIAHLNSILEDYNDQRKELEEKWNLENPNPRQTRHSNLSEKRKTEHKRSLKRKKFNDELKRLKKSIFLEYKQELALLHNSGAGALLQTDAIRNASQFKELEEIAAKGLGVLGFEEVELTHKKDFPLLKPIDDQTARLAVQERFQRIDQHISSLLSDQRNKHKTDQEYLDRLQKNPSEKEDLKKWYQDQRFKRLSKLILSNPQTISSVLLNNPHYSSILCQTVERIKKDKKFKDMLKTGMFVGSAIGSVTVALLTAGTGAPASFAATFSLATGTGLTAADFALRISEVNRHSRNQEDLLNAYLSQTGDNQSIEDIRKEWKSKAKQKFHAGWALALGSFDVYRIGSALKKGKLARQETPTLQIKDNQLQKIISENNQYVEAIQSLLQKHPLRSVQRLLDSIRRLSPEQQKKVLDSFSKIAKKDSFNLISFSREIKQSISRQNISQILKSWAICHSCRVKVGTKKQKDSSDSKSIIESSRL